MNNIIFSKPIRRVDTKERENIADVYNKLTELKIDMIDREI